MLKKNLFGAIVIWSVLVVVLSYLLTGSFNPLQVFYLESSVLAKIVIGVLLFFLAVSGLQLLLVLSPMGEKKCPICNKPLMEFVPVYGKPKVCWTCLRSGRKTNYHEKCYKAKGKCPVCEEREPWGAF